LILSTSKKKKLPSVVTPENGMSQDIEKSLKALEAKFTELIVKITRQEERKISQDHRIKRMEERAKRIDGYISKFVWIVVVAILGSFLTFALNGGLALN